MPADAFVPIAPVCANPTDEAVALGNEIAAAAVCAALAVGFAPKAASSEPRRTSGLRRGSTTQRMFQCTCAHCHKHLRFKLNCPAEGCTVQTRCASCNAKLRVNVPPLVSTPSAKSIYNEGISQGSSLAEKPPGSTSHRLENGPSTAVRTAREAALAEEAKEDDDTPLSLSSALLHWHWANLEYANGTTLSSLSNRWWDADDEVSVADHVP